MNTRIFLIILPTFLCIFVPFTPCRATERPPLFLRLGEQRILNFTHLDRYSVSGTAIRYTRLPGQNELLIKGASPGMSTILITRGKENSSQTIRVEAKAESPYPHPLFQALNLLETTETIDGGTQFILRGEIGSIKEARAVSHLKKHFPSWIIDETSIAPQWLERNIQQISELLKPYPHLKLISSEGVIAIQGPIASEFTVYGLMKKIQEIQPLTQFDFQTTKGFSPTLYFKVFLLEVKKEFKSTLGTVLTEPGRPLLKGSLNFPPFEAIVDNPISYSIHALADRGMIRVLSAPELVVKSPGQAELFAGGELPIHLRSRLEDKVVWKNIGLSLKLDVKEYNGEKVRLSIETELSHLDAELKVDEIPGVKTNRLKTQVEGTIGKPLLLSGLLQEESRNNMRGIPGLIDIPILGALFGSEDYQKNRSELVAVLLPYREPPHEPMQRISSDIPLGYLPLSRNHLNQDQVELLQSNRKYPWNAL